MQNIKITQIEPIITKHRSNLEFIIFNFLTKFKLKKICDRSKVQKSEGHRVIEILFIALTLPFMLVSSVNAIFRSEFKWVAEKFEKCCIYRFLNNSCYDWRKLIYKVCFKFVKLFPTDGA